mgnify:FL=1
MNISYNEPEHFTFLKELSHLEELSMEQTGFKDMALLNSLGDLKVLNVSKNRLKNLEKFTNVEHLEKLDAKFCQLTEINFLKNAHQ